MVEISTESMNLTVPAQLAGVSRQSRFSRSGRIRNRPGSAGTRVSLSSAAHAGWVKSPVPSTRMPLGSAHQDRCSISQSLLQARENLEWMCRSAWNMAGLILPWSTDIRARNSRVPGPVSRLRAHVVRVRPSGDAVHPVDGPAVHSDSGVVLADRVLVRPVEQAVHLAVGVVVQLDLAHAELVRPLVAGVVGDLRDGFGRQLEIGVEIHEPGHVSSPFPGRRVTGLRRKSAGPAGGPAGGGPC